MFYNTEVKYNTKDKVTTMVPKPLTFVPKSLKSQLVKRTSLDLKNSRVAAYGYLIP